VTLPFEHYLVGGAVRDALLGLPVHERDWVVVGADPQTLREAGFKPVGKDFPVFLHPETGEEYALARTERKQGEGHTGFVFHAAPEVSLEEDLRRRDLTINAMAQTEDGELIDPFGGKADLERRLLRHVSEAFVEDPLRVLRVARFAAKLAPQGFGVAPETLTLMREISASGELETLSGPRIWQELEKALASPQPSVFFYLLRECGALARLLPELDALFGVPQPPRWHPEIDCGIHTMLVVDTAARLSESRAVRFAALVHDLGKANTPADILPSHHGHEGRGVKRIQALAKRLPVPKAWRELARIVARYHGHCHRVARLKPGTVLKVLEATDAFRRPERFADFLLACEADARGRTGLENEPYPQREQFAALREAAARVDPQVLIAEGYSGAALGRKLAEARRQAVDFARREFAPVE